MLMKPNAVSALTTPSKKSLSVPKSNNNLIVLTTEEITKLRRKKFKEKMQETENQQIKQLISPYVDDLQKTVLQNSHQELEMIYENANSAMPQGDLGISSIDNNYSSVFKK